MSEAPAYRSGLLGNRSKPENSKKAATFRQKENLADSGFGV
jgi:hypothetical protein